MDPLMTRQNDNRAHSLMKGQNDREKLSGVYLVMQGQGDHLPEFIL